MIELFALVNLTTANAQSAVARGRAPAIAKLYTVILWFLFEAIGFFAGAAVSLACGWELKLSLLYLFAALPLAGLGGLLSNRLAKRGETFYTPSR